jgi:MerR family transcriptional regulator, mercuric resistance operon regulatory protein
MAEGLQEFTIGKLSEYTGVHVETIRYYEKIGLLPAPPRSAGGHRLYAHEHRERLVFLRRSRDLGFSLEDIRALLELAAGGEFTCKEVKTLTIQHLQHVRQKIKDLRKLERALVHISSRCEKGAAQTCPILEMLFEATSPPH